MSDSGATVKALFLTVLAFFLFVSTAHAQKLYVAAHVSGKQAVPDPFRFSAIVGYPNQQVIGIPFWLYVKGSRSPLSNLPERWYVYVNGQRVHDAQFGYFVMNPNKLGWQKYVAAECGPQCFLDGLGPSSVKRTTPKLNWTVAQWVNAASNLVTYVSKAGHKVLPNSIGRSVDTAKIYLAASGGRGSTEDFTPTTASWLLPLGHIWVQEIGDCQTKYDAYLKYTDGNDRFSCHEYGTPAWDLSWMQ